MCALVLGKGGGFALKTDEYVKIHEKKKTPTIKPKGSISVRLLGAFARKPEGEDE